jgi:hypothetical protein
VETLTFRAFPRWLVVAQTLLALVATPLSLIGLGGGDTLQGLVFLALGLVNGGSAAFQSQQRLTVSETGLSLPTGLRPTSVDWSEIERIHVDWSAATGVGDREVFHVERRDRVTLSSGVPMGMSSTRRHHAELEQLLDRRAEAYGFEFEVTDSWRERPSRGGSAAD